MDVLITAAEDAALVFGIEGDGAQTAAAFRTRWGMSAVAVTMGAGGALVDDGSAAVTHVAAAPAVEVVDRLGAGDAFAAGLLTAYLEDGDLARGARLGMAMASLKLTIPGDEFFFTRAEVEALAAGETVTTLRR